jgi:hypothetical protein
MLNFAHATTTATQKRVGTYSKNKATFATVTGASFTGALDPMDEQMSLALGLAGQGYRFTTEGGADIKANDILIINSVEYHVRGVSRYTQGAIDILKCILVLSVKK